MAAAPATRPTTRFEVDGLGWRLVPTTGAYRSRITCALQRDGFTRGREYQIFRFACVTIATAMGLAIPGSVPWSPPAHGVLRGTQDAPRRANRSSPLIAALGNERLSHAVGISAYDAFVRSSAREQEENAYARNPPSTRQSVPIRGDSGFAPSMGSSRSFLG